MEMSKPAPVSNALRPRASSPTPFLHTRYSSAAHVRTCVERVASILSRPSLAYAREFLFGNDPRTDIASISNPVCVSHAVLANKQATPARDVSSEAESFRYSSTAVFIPVMSVFSEGAPRSSYTLGIQLSVASAGSPTAMSSSCAPVVICKYLLNNINGEKIEVAPRDEKNSPTSTIYVTRMRSTREVELTSVSVSTRLFLAGLRTSDKELMLASTLIAQSCIALRNCTGCNAPVSTSCRCVVSTSEPLHPLDFSSHTANMVLHQGQFTSETSTVFNKQIKDRSLISAREWWSKLSGATDESQKELFSPVLNGALTASMLYFMDNSSRNTLVQQALCGLLQNVTLVSTAPSVASLVSGGRRDSLLEYVSEEASEEHRIEQTVRLLRNEASMPTSSAEATRDAGVSEVSATLCDPRTTRMLHRQQRNRQAAARSNARRKHLQESRVEELRNNRARIMELRAREVALRDENAILRARVRSGT